MPALLPKLKYYTGQAGYRLFRACLPKVVPNDTPQSDLYQGPEDFSPLYRPWLGSEFDDLFAPDVLANTMLSRKKLYLLLKLFSQTRNIPGDNFEAGVGSGGSARLMQRAMLKAGIRKSLWLLDTFEGYQKVDASKDGSHVQLNQCRCNSFEDVQKLLKTDGFDVHLIKGLIPGTLSQVKADTISFAHIDVNLYEPTLEATLFCLERMPPGGIILFDDYCWPGTFGARRAIDEACARHNIEPICLPESTQAFLIKN